MTARPSPTYRLPLWFIAQWLLMAPLRTHRHLGRDAERLVGARRPAPRVIGLDFVPHDGPFVIVMNHYERPGLRVWWAALWVSALLWRARGEDPPLRWLISGEFYRFRVGPLRVPDRLIASLLSTIAARYALIVVRRRESARGARSAALREAEATLRAAGTAARPVGITPEAARSHGAALTRPSRNAGVTLAYLSQGAVPLLPVAVYEDDDGRLTARFGEPFTLPWPGLREARAAEPPLADVAMLRLAALLPEAFRGPYAGQAGEPPASSTDA